MKATLLLIGLMALGGCSTALPINGVRVTQQGVRNDEGSDLHHVKIWGEMWTGGRRIWLLTSKREVWHKGAIWNPHYRFSAIDSLDLKGKCDEGRFEIHWP